MGGSKGRPRRDRPEEVRALYEQITNLDCMLTSLETQIEVLSTVQDGLPKEFNDTFHDSGTSGHEPDSLEAIETLVSEDRAKSSSSPNGAAAPRSGETDDDGAELKPSDATVLLQLERCAHRQTRRALQLAKRRIADSEAEAQRKAQLATNMMDKDQNGLQKGSSFYRNPNSLDNSFSDASAEKILQEIKESEFPSSTSIKILFPSPYLTQLRQMTANQLRMRVLHLEKAQLDKVPKDAAKEMSRLNGLMIQLEKERDEATLQNFTLKSRLAEVTAKISDPAATYQVKTDSLIIKPDSEDPDLVKIFKKSTYKANSESQRLRQVLYAFEAKEVEYENKMSHLEMRLKNELNSANQDYDRHMRNIESKLEEVQKKAEATERFLLQKEEEANMLKLDLETLAEENRRLKEQLHRLVDMEQNTKELEAKCLDLEAKYLGLKKENKMLSEDYNRERLLRKKYFNMIEEMKGKIRVFCRLRPINELERLKGGREVVQFEDECSLLLETPKGGRRAFHFDRVFTPSDGQQTVFQDTHVLIQSVLDGYNVTIMAYGQTGSGKTYTMLGTPGSPGIAPRAFDNLFDLISANSPRYEISASAYMLELYNDKVLDLLKINVMGEASEKLDIKKDKKGAVYVTGATIRPVGDAGELNRAFEEGLASRHTSATKLNVSSSRSHLLIAVMLNIVSRQTGATLTGKLTLVDLAGSERVQKSGVSADRLKEANSINKSLSALGDVIAALSSEAPFVPYRNSKLTMLLQDSVGGNAKTLVFVNVSPASYNCDETLVSLMYATRIKQVTNAPYKNADNKEISRLKAIITKLRKGECSDNEV